MRPAVLVGFVQQWLPVASGACFFLRRFLWHGCLSERHNQLCAPNPSHFHMASRPWLRALQIAGVLITTTVLVPVLLAESRFVVRGSEYASRCSVCS